MTRASPSARATADGAPQQRAPLWMSIVAFPGGLVLSYMALMLGGLLMFKVVVPLNVVILTFSRDGPPSPWGMRVLASVTLLVILATAGDRIRRGLPRPAGALFAVGWYAPLVLAVVVAVRLGGDAF